VTTGKFTARPTELFGAFLRLGAISFGGPAMVAYMRELAVRKKRWLSAESFDQGVALCQSIPGATAMQTAAYVGLRAGGLRGAFGAFAGFGLPAFVLILLFSAAYDQTRGVTTVAAAFRGLQVIVVALIANAVLSFGRSSIRSWRDALPALGAGAFLWGRGSPIVAISAAAALGLLLHRRVNAAAPPSSRSEPPYRPIRFALVFVGAMAAALAALFILDRTLFDLAALMIRVDLFAFGGGFAAVPLMLHETVDVRGWMTHKTFMDGIALGQVTPGPVVITATFVGHQVAGLPGALVGTAGIFAPSFLLIPVTVPYLDRLRRSALFARAVRGILSSFVGLLLAVAVNFALDVGWTLPLLMLALAAFVALRLKADILWVVLLGGAAAVVLGLAGLY